MPATVPAIAFLGGLVLILVALFASEIEAFGVDVHVRRVSTSVRIIAFLIGLVLIAYGAYAAGFYPGGTEQTQSMESEAGTNTSKPLNDEPAVQGSTTTSPHGDNNRSTAVLVEAVEDYYQAVDREDWAYTYQNLDSQTKVMFTEEEWYCKNRNLAEGLELATMEVAVNGSPSDPVVSVTVYRTFKDGTSITRSTYFVYEDDSWKHRFSQQEIELFMPGTPCA